MRIYHGRKRRFFLIFAFAFAPECQFFLPLLQ
jgi:hypothetical protein